MNERRIENNIMRNAHVLGIQAAHSIRRCRIGPGFGVADLVFLPVHGPHRVVIVEAKSASSADATIKVLGQLLMYYAGITKLGLRGLKLMRIYAANRSQHARSVGMTSLKALSGGVGPPERAWEELQKGRKLWPERVALYVALDAAPSEALRSSLEVLHSHHGLTAGVVTVRGRDQLEVWRAG